MNALEMNAYLAQASYQGNYLNANIAQAQSFYSYLASLNAQNIARRELGDPRMPRPRNINPKQRMSDEAARRFNAAGLLRAA